MLCAEQLLADEGLDSSLRTSGWVRSFTKAQKHILLAAFIAGSNHKKTDYDVFGAGRLGKRRRSRIGSKNSSLTGGEGGTSSVNGEISSSNNNVNRGGFDLDRLFVKLAL